MKINIFLLAISVCLCFTACKDHGKSALDSSRIKQVTSSRGSTTTYVYNTDNTLSYSTTGTGAKTSYKLSGNVINEEIVDSMRGQFVHSTIYLNANGIADSTTATVPQGTFVKTYSHDANGFIIESKDFNNGKLADATTSTVKDGNQMDAAVMDTAMKPIFKVFFDYYPDQLNSMSYLNYGMKFLGSDSKNLIKRFVQILPTGDTVRISTFKYYFDDKGRVSSKVMHDKAGMVIDSSTVTYY